MPDIVGLTYLCYCYLLTYFTYLLIILSLYWVVNSLGRKENARPPTPMTDKTKLISPLINIRIVAKTWPAVSCLHIHLFLYSSFSDDADVN